jgi:hypothetical protein
MPLILCIIEQKTTQVSEHLENTKENTQKHNNYSLLKKI